MKQRSSALSWLLLISLLIASIMCASQISLFQLRPDQLEAGVEPRVTADYSRWPTVQFGQIDPALGTLVAQENGAPEAAIIVGQFVTDAPTSVPPAPTDTPLPAAPPPTSEAQVASVPTTAPTTAVEEQVVVPSATITETPQVTVTSTPEITATPTLTYTPTNTSEVAVAPPVAAFITNVLTGVAPLNVQFTNQSTGTITSHLWDFGDGSILQSVHSSHVYANPGIYTVTLIIVGPGGSSSVTTTITVQTPTPTPFTALVAPTKTPTLTPTLTYTPTLTPTPTVTLTRTPTLTPTSIPNCPVAGEPDVGTADGLLCGLVSNQSIVLDMGCPILLSGPYDLVYYEEPQFVNNEIQLDRIIIQVGTSPTGPWTTVFNWGDGVLDANTNVGAAGYGAGSEPNDLPIPMTNPPLYGIPPLVSGVAINVTTPGFYRYVQLTAPASIYPVFDAVQAFGCEPPTTTPTPTPTNTLTPTPTATNTPMVADMSVNINTSNPTPAEAEIVTLTLNVTNLGGATATAAMLNIPVPAGMTYQSFSGAGSYDSSSGVWTLGDMSSGQNYTLNLTLQVNTGIAPMSITAFASVSSSVTDPNGGNNNASVNMNVP